MDRLMITNVTVMQKSDYKILKVRGQRSGLDQVSVQLAPS